MDMMEEAALSQNAMATDGLHKHCVFTCELVLGVLKKPFMQSPGTK